jgi:hypothetical protein
MKSKDRLRGIIAFLGNVLASFIANYIWLPFSNATFRFVPEDFMKSSGFLWICPGIITLLLGIMHLLIYHLSCFRRGENLFFRLHRIYVICTIVSFIGFAGMCIYNILAQDHFFSDFLSLFLIFYYFVVWVLDIFIFYFFLRYRGPFWIFHALGVHKLKKLN